MPVVYIEKGVGLHTAIEAAGHRLERRNGVWIADDIPATQAIIDAYVGVPSPLTPPQFLYFSAALGVAKFWPLLTDLLESTGSPDYPRAYAWHSKAEFTFEDVVTFLDEFSVELAAVSASLDLSDGPVRTAWDAALFVDQ